MRKRSGILIAFMVVLAFVVGGLTTYVVLDRTVDIDVNIEDDEFANFLEVLTEIRRSHYFYDGEGDLMRGAIEGMLAATGDSYSNFFSPDDFDTSRTHLRGSFYGIGAEVQTINDQSVIVAPFPGSPAENYGVMPGDIVISVDGEDVRDYDLGDVISRIRGDYGTVVTLEVLRGNATNSIHISVTRGRIANETVRTSTLNFDGRNIGYLQVTTFGEETYNEFRAGIAELEANGIDGLIIDMRNNPGGYLHTVTQMLSYLLPSGDLITSAVDRNGNEQSYMTQGSSRPRLDVEIVTLINEGSASASEIFAAAMMEIAGAEVVGTTSFGKGTVQQSRTLRSGDILQLTTQAWLTPNGNLIEGHGVTPTVYVEAPDFYFFLQVHLGDENILIYDMVHTGIASAQNILNLLGYDVDRTDGYFDSSTINAVRNFQRNNDLRPTGDIDSETATLLTIKWREMVRNPAYDAQLLAAVDLFE